MEKLRKQVVPCAALLIISLNYMQVLYVRQRRLNYVMQSARQTRINRTNCCIKEGTLPLRKENLHVKEELEKKTSLDIFHRNEPYSLLICTSFLFLGPHTLDLRL